MNCQMTMTQRQMTVQRQKARRSRKLQKTIPQMKINSPAKEMFYEVSGFAEA